MIKKEIFIGRNSQGVRLAIFIGMHVIIKWDIFPFHTLIHTPLQAPALIPLIQQSVENSLSMRFSRVRHISVERAKTITSIPKTTRKNLQENDEPNELDC